MRLISAPEKSAPRQSAPYRQARERSARTKQASRRSARDKSAPRKLALEKFTPRRFFPRRSARSRLEPTRAQWTAISTSVRGFVSAPIGDVYPVGGVSLGYTLARDNDFFFGCPRQFEAVLRHMAAFVGRRLREGLIFLHLPDQPLVLRYDRQQRPPVAVKKVYV